MNHISLFSGIGGVDLAAEEAGFKTVAFCEQDKFCQSVLRKHWKDVPIWSDIKDVSYESLRNKGIENVTLLTGGFPCQPFSVAGEQRGKDDDRYLWPEMFRVIKEVRPTWIVGENVAGIINLGLEDVLADLESIKYSVRVFVIPACSINAPHKRRRVFIVAYSRRKLHKRSKFRGTNENEVRNRDADKLKRPGKTCENVGDSYCIGCNSRKCDREGRQFQDNINWNAEEENTKRSGRILRTCEDGKTLADTTSKGLQGSKWTEQEGPGIGSANSLCIGEQRTAQPRLGRMSDGIPRRLDEHRWPAGFGIDQYEWEPPRTIAKVKNREKRLKALGNAVVPQQIYPILKQIYNIEIALRNGFVMEKDFNIKDELREYLKPIRRSLAWLGFEIGYRDRQNFDYKLKNNKITLDEGIEIFYVINKQYQAKGMKPVKFEELYKGYFYNSLLKTVKNK